MSMKQTCCRRSSFACRSVALHDPFSLPATQLLAFDLQKPPTAWQCPACGDGEPDGERGGPPLAVWLVRGVVGFSGRMMGTPRLLGCLTQAPRVRRCSSCGRARRSTARRTSTGRWS